jgi:hypothetical protein
MAYTELKYLTWSNLIPTWIKRGANLVPIWFYREAESDLHASIYLLDCGNMYWSLVKII